MQNRIMSPRCGLVWLGLALLIGLTFSAGRAQAQTTSVTRTSSWTYSTTTGLITSETVQSTATSTSSCISSSGDNTCSVTTTYAYDAYGNKVAVAVSGTSLPAALNGIGGNTTSSGASVTRTTTTVYDSQGEFAISVTNGLGQTESWAYNGSFGVPTSHTGPNGVTTSWYYDSLGRKTGEQRADGTVTNWNFFYGQFNSPLGAYRILTGYSVNSGGNWIQTAPSSLVLYDTLGRPIDSSNQVWNGSAIWTNMWTNYNANGQVASADTIPVLSSSNPTTYTYDALGRVLTVSVPNNPAQLLTQSSYNGLTTTDIKYSSYTSATNNVSETTSTSDNDLGLPATVVDNPGNSNVNNTTTTNYTYDPLGDLLSMSIVATIGSSTTPTTTTTSYTYDSDGRKTQMVDPDRGTWNYAYDALGELTSQTDAKNQTTTFTYDALGRLLVRQQSDQTDSWQYDLGSDGVGKLYGEESCQSAGGSSCQLNGTGPISKRTQVYDSIGRPVRSTIDNYGSTTTTIGATVTAYDTSGRVSQVTYPSGFEVQYNYDSIGVLSSLINAATGQALWTLGSTNAAGQVLTETLGNGIVVTNTYDPNFSRLTTTMAGLSTATQTGDASTSNVANFTYVYDNLGDLTEREDADADTPNTQTAPTLLSETFTYDSLYRLTGDTVFANGSQSGATSFAYDGAGDITYKSDTGTYSYGTGATGGPHAVSSIICSTTSCSSPAYNLNVRYTYDTDGNRLRDQQYDDYTATWMSFNMASTITQNDRTYTYGYDAEHNRISQLQTEANTTSTLYFTDPNTGLRSEFATNSSGSTTWTDYLMADSEMVGIHITQSATSASGPCPSTVSQCNRFFIRDHLGSVAVITGDIGCSGLVQGGSSSCLIERDNYDAWGKRRNANSWLPDYQNQVNSGQTTRGFTGQEMLQNANAGIELINMNARIYDPETGRFFSPDPLNQPSTNAQALNPYSYVLNNPLSATDPTGLKCHGWFGCTFGSIGETILGIAAAVAVAYFAPEFEEQFLDINASALAPGSALATANAVLAGAADGAVSSDFSWQGALIGAGEAGAFYEVGTLTNGHFDYTNGTNAAGQTLQAWAENDPGEFAANVAGHGLVGGLASVAGGGSFQSGFLAAGFSDAASPYIDTGNFYGNLVSQSVTGGIASVAGGGSFANGAETGAFGYLFNSQGGRRIGGAIGRWIGGILGAIPTGPEDVPLEGAGAVAGGAVGGEIGDAVTGPDVTDRLPVPAVPDGMSPNSFGNDVVQWGTGADAANSRAESLTPDDVQQMANQGLTQQMAQNWMDFYNSAAAAGRGLPVSPARANLMQQILNNWPK